MEFFGPDPEQIMKFSGLAQNRKDVCYQSWVVTGNNIIFLGVQKRLRIFLARSIKYGILRPGPDHFRNFLAGV